jgi:tetratricopeptide (TPR) repeat protein
MGRTAEAETEFLEAAGIDDNPAIWFSLARMYQLQGRLPEAIHAVEKMVEISPRPFSALLTLGHIDLEAHRPKDALDALARARKSLPDDPEVAVGKATLADLAHSRALARRDLGDLTGAVSDQEEAVRFAPDDSHGWLQLADLYDLQGRVDDAKIARERAASASEPQSKR